jgi:hypothetical protein
MVRPYARWVLQLFTKCRLARSSLAPILPMKSKVPELFGLCSKFEQAFAAFELWARRGRSHPPDRRVFCPMYLPCVGAWQTFLGPSYAHQVKLALGSALGEF